VQVLNDRKSLCSTVPTHEQRPQYIERGCQTEPDEPRLHKDVCIRTEDMLEAVQLVHRDRPYITSPSAQPLPAKYTEPTISQESCATTSTDVGGDGWVWSGLHAQYSADQ